MEEAAQWLGPRREQRVTCARQGAFLTQAAPGLNIVAVLQNVISLSKPLNNIMTLLSKPRLSLLAQMFLSVSAMYQLSKCVCVCVCDHDKGWENVHILECVHILVLKKIPC